MIQRGRFSLLAQNAAAPALSAAYTETTLDLVQRCTVIDMLGLLTLNYARLETWEARAAAFTAADFDKLRASGMQIPTSVFQTVVEIGGSPLP